MAYFKCNHLMPLHVKGLETFRIDSRGILEQHTGVIISTTIQAVH